MRPLLVAILVVGLIVVVAIGADIVMWELFGG